MGLMDYVFGNKGKQTAEELGSQDYYGPYSQMIDPNAVALMNAPSQTNKEMAEFTTDNDEAIEKFKQGLRGYRVIKRYDIKTGQVLLEQERLGEPAMNDEGVNELGRDLDMYLSKPFLLSNVPIGDKKRVDNMMRIIWKRISNKLIVNANRYQLDKTRRPSIVSQMCLTIYFNCMRSFDDGERPLLYGSHKTMQTITTQNNPQAEPKKHWGIF